MRIFDQTRQKGLLALLLCVAAVAIWPGIALAEGGKSSVTPPPPPVFQIQQDDACGHDPKITTAEAVLEECTRAIERGDLSDEELSRAYLIRVLALQALGWANNKEYESYNKSLHTDIDAALKLTPHSADANYFKCNHREFSERGDLKYCFEAIKYNKKHYEAHYEIGTNFQDEAQSLRLASRRRAALICSTCLPCARAALDYAALACLCRGRHDLHSFGILAPGWSDLPQCILHFAAPLIAAQAKTSIAECGARRMAK